MSSAVPPVIAERRLVTITVLGREVRVGEGTTILNAVRGAGHSELLGCGCRLGDCGECAIAVRLPGETMPRRELSCIAPVVDGMAVCETPFPWTRAFHRRAERS